MQNIPSWLQSSADPAQISLSIESAGKMLIGIVGIVAVAKGMNPATAQAGFQSILDQVALAVTSAFAFYHAIMTVYGLGRKAFLAFVK